MGVEPEFVRHFQVAATAGGGAVQEKHRGALVPGVGFLALEKERHGVEAFFPGEPAFVAHRLRIGIPQAPELFDERLPPVVVAEVQKSFPFGIAQQEGHGFEPRCVGRGQG